MPEPLFGIIFGDNGAFSDFSTAQPPRFEFFIDLSSTEAVDLGELLNAECPLSGTTLPLCF
jgi:hypothetical protein